MTLYPPNQEAYLPLRSLMNLIGESSVARKPHPHRHRKVERSEWDRLAAGPAMAVGEETLDLVTIMVALTEHIITATVT